MLKLIRGVLPIAHTPFLNDDSIDFESLRRQVDWAFEVGADGLGTGAFFAGVGAESTKQALEYARLAERAGADAVMAIPPISTRLPVAAVRDYFIALADGVGIPIIVQDASGYVGQPIPIPVCVELLRRFNVPGRLGDGGLV